MPSYAKSKELFVATYSTLLRGILGDCPDSIENRAVIVCLGLLWAPDEGAVVSGILGRCTLDNGQEFS